ncbi:hypothetical protein [Bartonella apis]|uniref:hypothetical protein n=1 Tax=Bartonella apis TaxID=1686310 RepID=UPI00242F57C5|nr:hypothetical protein [Bartonella apis]
MGGKEKTENRKLRGGERVSENIGSKREKLVNHWSKKKQLLQESMTIAARMRDDCPLGADGTLPVNEVITANCFAEIVRNTYIDKV